MTERRQVRVDPAFFDELDQQLGPSRGPRGEPSSTDFLTMDLPTIVEEFAERLETLSPDGPTIEYWSLRERSSLRQSPSGSSGPTTQSSSSASRST